MKQAAREEQNKAELRDLADKDAKVIKKLKTALAETEN